MLPPVAVDANGTQILHSLDPLLGFPVPATHAAGNLMIYLLAWASAYLAGPFVAV